MNTHGVLELRFGARRLGRHLTVIHSGISSSRRRRQLRIVRGQELVFADIHTFVFVGGGDLDHGLWLAAQHK